MTNPERTQQIKELFQAALEYEPSARPAFLAEVCADDDELRREVESLLLWETQAEKFIEKPALKVAAEIFAADKTASLIGQKVAGYKIEKQLGAGGMGEVYLAYDHRLGRRIALKLLPEHFTQDQQRVRRFVQESRAASALNHPNIVTIYEIGNDQHRHFIAQEFVEGQTLRERLLRTPMKLPEAIDVAIQIVAALTAAHEVGIVHRDIKPENIMLRPDGYVKVLDFGLAKLLWRYPVGTETNTDSELHSSFISDPSTTPGLVMGTVRYMSPEQLRGVDVDARSDIFSLGIVLYEMISGQRPFAGETTADVIAAILERESVPLAELNAETPKPLESIVNKALKKRREERYQNSHELLADLRELQQELEFEERQRSKGQRVSSLSKAAQATSAKLPSNKFKSKRFVITAAALMLMLIAGTVTWRYVKQRQAQQQIAQIQTLVEQQRFFEAYDLARQAQKYLPQDATLAQLMPTITDSLTVASEPSGASVYLRRFNSEQREKIGLTPIVNLPVARGAYILSVEKEGFATAERTISSQLTRTGNALVPPDEPRDFAIKLVAADKTPHRMVSIPGGQYKLASRSRLKNTRVELDDFFIDKYEVTNREYKEFIDAGGYFKRELWQYPFAKDGQVMTWEKAMLSFRDRTGLPGPRNWSGQVFPEGQAEHPVTDITWYEAAAYARFRGKQLPTIFQWEKAARNGTFTYYMGYVLPWGAVEFSGTTTKHANFNGRGTVPVDQFAFGMSPFGCYQMAGNVSEWCLNEMSNGFTVAGGSWNDPFYIFSDFGGLPGFHSSNKLGFRCVLNSPEAKSDQGAMKLDPSNQIPSYAPTSQAEFDAMLSHFRYDQQPLAAQTIEVKETSEWRREKIAYIGAKDERALAYLYLPKSAAPPFQVIQYVPAGDVYGGYFTAAQSAEMQVAPFIKAGRAVFTVVFKGFREREFPTDYALPKWDTVKRREEVVGHATDLSRGLDYLATRNDIDLKRLAFYGFSEGAEEGLIFAAVEHRFSAAVFVAGSIPTSAGSWIAEANPARFASHIQMPKLLLNGRYDEVNPLRTTIEPLFKLLREPKKIFLYDSGHSPPFEITVPIINQWLDENLGVVRRRT